MCEASAMIFGPKKVVAPGSATYVAQQATAHDPGPSRQAKNVQLSTNASSWTPRMCTCQLVELQLVFSIVQSYTFLSPRRESWPPEGRHNRIRHIDPPKSSRFQNLKLTQQAPAHDPSPPRNQKMNVCGCALAFCPLKIASF